MPATPTTETERVSMGAMSVEGTVGTVKAEDTAAKARVAKTATDLKENIVNECGVW